MQYRMQQSAPWDAFNFCSCCVQEQANRLLAGHSAFSSRCQLGFSIIAKDCMEHPTAIPSSWPIPSHQSALPVPWFCGAISPALPVTKRDPRSVSFLYLSYVAASKPASRNPDRARLGSSNRIFIHQLISPCCLTIHSVHSDPKTAASRPV